MEPLLELLHETSAMADVFFEPEGRMMAHIIAIGRDGKRSLFACPMANAEEERVFRIGVPQSLKRSGMLRWCFFCEAWAASYRKDESAQAAPPAARPDRIEVVTFLAEDASGATLQASRQILRGLGPAKLLPLVIAKRPGPYVVGEKQTSR